MLEEKIKKEFAAKPARRPGREKLEIVLFASASRLRTASVGQARRGGRKGGLVFALPPAEPVNEIGSPACRQAGIFSNTHRQLEKEAFDSPADFERKIEFFVFQNKVRADIF